MNDINYEELQERVQKALKRQKLAMRWAFLGTNVLFFLIFVFMFIALQSNPASPINNLPEHVSGVLMLPFLLWPIAILMQFGNALVESGIMDKQMAANLVGKELGQQILENKLQAVTEKAKRQSQDLDDEAMTISDDGELVPLDEAATGRHSAQR